VTPRDANHGHTPRLHAEMRERETVRPLELFFDLVFVLGFTQCTALMASEPNWQGLLRGCLALALLWWTWAGFAWLTSIIDPEEGVVRLLMLGVMSALLVAALCVPDAFNDRALTFAIAYGVVRAAHIMLFLVGAHDSAALRHSVLGFAVSSAAGVTLLVSASFLDADGQTILWAVAIIVDLAGGLFGVAGWSLVPAHFAERHNLVIILALGESIVALGVGTHVDLTTPVIIAVVLGMALASALWWIYFDVVALVTQQRLTRSEPGRERNRLARDSYSYLHLPMVTGIVLAAFALEGTLEHVDEPLDGEHVFALLGGLRNAHTLNRQRFVLALVLLAAVPFATEIDALAVLIAVDVLLWLMIAYETHLYGERRYQLRHGEAPIPGAPIGGERT
jgi:low temperature requirement protein LtrA